MRAVGIGPAGVLQAMVMLGAARPLYLYVGLHSACYPAVRCCRQSVAENEVTTIGSSEDRVVVAGHAVRSALTMRYT